MCFIIRTKLQEQVCQWVACVVIQWMKTTLLMWTCIKFSSQKKFRVLDWGLRHYCNHLPEGFVLVLSSLMGLHHFLFSVSCHYYAHYSHVTGVSIMLSNDCRFCAVMLVLFSCLSLSCPFIWSMLFSCSAVILYLDNFLYPSYVSVKPLLLFWAGLV